VNIARGFTLVELMVSLALLSMIVLVGASAFGLFAQRWDGRLGTFDMAMRNAQNRMLVQDVLDSLVPYVAFDREGRPIIYFEGNRNGFVGVSSKSIFSYGDFAVVRFSVRQKADLQFDVLYEEWPMDRDILVTIEQPLVFSPPITLFSDVRDPVFRYFGWADVSDRSEEELVRLPPRWTDQYDGVLALFSPLKADLSFVTDAGKYRIAASLTTAKPGLLSRYKVRPNRPVEPGVTPVVIEDCGC
jgi:prepilin-type N-terminal cleavage/methylation domain-containing protein